MQADRNCGNVLELSEEARAVDRFTDEITSELKEKKAVKVWGLGDIRFYECPLTCITQDTLDIRRAVYLTEHSGALLCPGGWAEQPFWFVEAYEVFKAEMIRAREKADHGKDNKTD